MLFLRSCSTLLTAAALAILAATPGNADPVKTVKITAIVEHPSLDAIRKGVIDELAAEGFIDGKTIAVEFQNAQSDIGTAGQIARKFTGDKPDVIIAITTPSAQAAAAAAHGVLPVIFSAINDPLAAKLVTSLEHPGGNVTGVSDRLPLEKQLALIREIVPKIKCLGVIFNPGEANSVSEVERLKTIAATQGIAVVEGAAPDTNSVLGAARGLVGKADALYLPTDNTAAAALEGILKVGIDARIPVFAADTDSVSRGAVAAAGFNYYDVGRQTGRMAARVLRGEKPGDIAVEEVDAIQVAINPASASRMGVVLPDSVVRRARIVVK